VTKASTKLKFDLDYQTHQHQDEKTKNRDLLDEINELHKQISEMEQERAKVYKDNST
jgi:hypothetical protein